MLIRLSPILAAAAGKTAELVVETWHGRHYVRRHVTKSDPRTIAQTSIRESYTRTVNLWRSLTTAVKSWLDQYAVPYQLSGYNVFVRDNRALEQASELLKPVPDQPRVPAPSSFNVVTEGDDKFTLTWTDPLISGFTKVYAAVRCHTDNRFVWQSLTTNAAAETLTTGALEHREDDDIFLALYNPTSGQFGTSVASEPPEPPVGPYYEDDFNRANDGLGADWSQVYKNGNSDWHIQDNKAVLVHPGGGGWQWTLAYYCESAYSDDHEVQAVLDEKVNGGIGLIARGNGVKTCYQGEVEGGGNNFGARIWKVISGVHTSLGFTNWSYDGTYKLVVNGNSIRLYKGAVLKVNVTDSSILTGIRIGMGCWTYDAGPSTLDDWKSDNVGEL